MRFRAQLTNAQTLLNIATALKDIASECYITLTPETLHFVLPSNLCEGAQVFADIPMKKLFIDCHLESRANNEILFLINLSNFIRALKSINQSEVGIIIMKLTKKGQIAFLTFDIQQLTRCTQDVPISVQPANKIQEYSEPDLPDPKIKVRLPPLKSLKHVVERMRSIDDTLTITANSIGELIFQVKTDMATVKTFYQGLRFTPADAGAAAGGDDAIVEASASVLIKKFVKVLGCAHVDPTVIIACIVEDHALIVHARLQKDCGVVTYFVPLVDR